MDPLTALSLAGTVVQFVDFGIKLFSEGRQLYHSISGKLDSNHEIEIATTDLLCRVKKLRQSFQKPGSNATFTADELEEQKRFQLICDRAVAIAQEIVDKLNGLVIPHHTTEKSGRRKLRTLVQLIKSRLNSHEIADLVARLEALRRAIDTQVLFSTK